MQKRHQLPGRTLAQANIFGKESPIKFHIYRKSGIHYANSYSGAELPLEQNGKQLVSCYLSNTMPFLKEMWF